MTFTLSKKMGSAKVFIIERSRLETRWDPNYYRCMSEFQNRIQDCPFPIEKLKKSLDLVQYGISERATEEPVGVPMLRMINLQDDTWDLADLKYIQMTECEKKPYLLEKGDILFNRTNSKELVGKCGVFNLPGEYVFASYLIRVRVRQETLQPDYITAFLSSGMGRIQIDAVSRQIAGMTNINAEEIRDLLIPTLDDKAQETVVRTWKSAIRKRDQTLEDARCILATVDEILLTELGIPPPTEPPNTLATRIFQSKLSEITGGRLDPIANQEKRRRLETAIHSSRYSVSPLRKLVGVEKTIVNEIEVGSTYVGLENIEGSSGAYIATAEKESVGTAVVFKQGQILFPKLRPYLNKTHLAKFAGICSTEFHVFTPRGVGGDFLAAMLRSRAIVGITSLLMTGNTLPRLQTSDIEKLPIPVPPPDVQKRLCDQIEGLKTEARKLRAAARANLETAKREIEMIILGKVAAK